MTQHDELVYLRHILDAAREACEIASGMTREDLDEDRLRQLAGTRLISPAVIVSRASPTASGCLPDHSESRIPSSFASLIATRQTDDGWSSVVGGPGYRRRSRRRKSSGSSRQSFKMG